MAPAGSYDAFVAAINAGAHAVYMGVNKFNARTMANNLSVEEYILAIDYAHKRNTKVYLTLNTLLFDNEIKEALEIVVRLYNAGLDAVILQDLGVASLIHKLMPDLPLHASTQMSVLNLEQVKYLEKVGFSRVVLGRELSIEEIAHIAKNTSLEIEVFVHGALCVCVSGQCMASTLIGDRSANRGSCAQPCRMKYSLYKSSSKKPLISEKYILSKKDIYGLDKLELLANAGVKSFKIEGRNRTVEYTAGVVSRYRNALDNSFESPKKVEKELLQLFNRSGKSEGYLNGVRYKDSISYNTPKNTGIALGKILSTKGDYAKIKLDESIDMHDGVEIINEKENISFIVTCIKDESGNILNSKCDAGNIVWLGDVKGKCEVGDFVYKTSNSKLNEEARRYLIAKEKNKRMPYNIQINIKRNENISAYVDNERINVQIEYVPEESKKIWVTEDKIKEVFSRTEDTAVKFINIHANIDDNLFLPISKLNELRRSLVQKLEQSKCIRRNIDINEISNVLNIEHKKKVDIKTTAVYMYRYNKETDYIKLCKERYNAKLDKLYVSARDFRIYEKDIMKYIVNDNLEVYFVIPNVVLKNMEKYIKENIERIILSGVKGLVIGNIGYLELASRLKEKYKIKLVGDYSLNITNKYTAKEFDILDCITPLFEAEQSDISGISQIKSLELVEGMATAMTTRYCIIASFAGEVSEKSECKGLCKKDNYYIIDDHIKKYDIVPDNTDCITEIIRNKRKYNNKDKEKHSIRYNIL